MHHSRLTVITSCLAAIHPDWFGIVHCYRPGRGRRRSKICCGNEAREESSSEGMTWILEGRLCDGVILQKSIELGLSLSKVEANLWMEVVCHSITWLSSDGFRVKSERSIFSHLDLKGCSCCRGNKTRDNERDNKSPRHFQTGIKLKESYEV